MHDTVGEELWKWGGWSAADTAMFRRRVEPSEVAVAVAAVVEEEEEEEGRWCHRGMTGRVGVRGTVDEELWKWGG